LRRKLRLTIGYLLRFQELPYSFNARMLPIFLVDEIAVSGVEKASVDHFLYTSSHGYRSRKQRQEGMVEIQLMILGCGRDYCTCVGL
jgi:hypothetical protein